MSTSRILIRGVAGRDIDEAIDHYLAEGGEDVSGNFVMALEQAYRHIAEFPESGSGRYADELNLPGLRAWPIRRYPFLVFYVPSGKDIEIWRVLHDKRDIPNSLRSIVNE